MHGERGGGHQDGYRGLEGWWYLWFDHMNRVEQMPPPLNLRSSTRKVHGERGGGDEDGDRGGQRRRLARRPLPRGPYLYIYSVDIHMYIYIYIYIYTFQVP